MGAKVVGSVYCNAGSLQTFTITPPAEYDYIEIIQVPVVTGTSEYTICKSCPIVTVANGGTGATEMYCTYTGSSVGYSSGYYIVSITCNANSVRLSTPSSIYASEFTCTIVFYKYNS